MHAQNKIFATGYRMTEKKERKNGKVLGARKQWKLLSEYAVSKNGDIETMKLDDLLYPGGPTIGKFLLTHYVAKCVSPALSSKKEQPSVVADAKAEEPPAPAPAAAAEPAAQPVAATATETPQREKRAAVEKDEKDKPASPKKKARSVLRTVLKL